MRDSEHDEWRRGTITELNPMKLRPEGSRSSSSYLWKFVEPAEKKAAPGKPTADDLPRTAAGAGDLASRRAQSSPSEPQGDNTPDGSRAGLAWPGWLFWSSQTSQTKPDPPDQTPARPDQRSSIRRAPAADPGSTMSPNKVRFSRTLQKYEFSDTDRSSDSGWRL